MFRPSHACPALLAALFAASAHAATTHTWPGAAPCAGTLQACIDAASDGDRIEIATDGPIGESIAMHARSLTLAAADGAVPVFSNAGIIANDSGGSGDMQVAVSGLHFEHGYLYATYASAGTATFDLRELVFDDAPGVGSSGLQVIAYAGTVNATLYDNRFVGLPQSLNSGLIRLAAQGGTLNANAYYNHVRSTSNAGVSGAGILVDVAGSGSGGMIKLHANEVRGSFYRGGIYLSEGLFSGTAVNYSARVYNNVVVGSGDGNGIGLTPNFGNIDAQLINNTVTRVNYGVLYSHWESGTGTTTGLLKNNLVRATTAVYAAVGNSINNDYNLFNGPTPNLVTGAHTITADAGLVSDALPRLSAASPAIDAGDTATLGVGLIVNNLPVTDADGLRRIKGANKADIGAYESGDTSFLHTASAATISGHITWLDDPAVNGAPSANLFATPNFNAGVPPSGVANGDAFGVWYSTGEWSLFHESTSVAMPNGAHYDVFSAGAGSGSFRHVASASTINGSFSQMSDSSVDNLPDRIVLATQNFSAGPVYNPHPIGVFYFAWGGPGAWLVANLDGAAMPAGAGFNVYSQTPSPNAFRVTATAANHLSDSTLVLDHPLLNDTPCAQPMVTRMYDGTTATGGFDVYYSGGHWLIFAYGSMPLGTTFNVLVNPAQVAACTDVIFANGFD